MTDRPGSAPFVESAIAPSTAAAATDPERARIAEGATDQPGRWWALGPYMSERAWGTVREDYSADGRAWDSFPHDHARSRAYRWSEDGLAGMCDVEQRLCFALSFWNGRDPILRLRPGDANEVVEAWKVIMQLRHQPVALVLSRQAMPTLDRTRYAPASGVARGAYVLADPPRGEPEVILIATGSEVSLCVAAYEELTAEGLRARVVSMPSWELFERQPEACRDSVLPPAITARVAVEQASTFGWAAYVGPLGEAIGMKTFGASAPLKALQTKFGFTPERVVAAARETLARSRARH